MNLTIAISGLAALPVVGMVVTASSIAATQPRPARPMVQQAEYAAPTDEGARCRTEAKAIGEYRRCGAGRWSKDQSAYR